MSASPHILQDAQSVSSSELVLLATYCDCCALKLSIFSCMLLFATLSQELEQMRRVNARKEEDMLNKHGIEKKRLPRIQKSEMKTRQQLFKQSLRISQMISPDQEREKIRHVSKLKCRLGEYTFCILILLFKIIFSWGYKINTNVVVITV